MTIVDLIRFLGGTAYVLGTRRRKGDFPGTMMTPGIGDVLAFVPHFGLGWLSIWIEVKTSIGRPSPAQVGFQQHCDLAGHRYFRGTADGFTAYLRSLGFRIQ